jgi:DNA replication protein DnaC
MLNEPTLEKLRDLRLGALADSWLEQQGNADLQALGFDERLAMLVDAEWLDRQNKKLARNLREAKLRLGQAAVEDIDYPTKRKLEKTVIRQLATCTWVEAHQNIIITGATGSGKTFISCALAQQACRKGYRALYRRVPRLFHELALVHADGTYPRFLAKLARIDVLVLDDWGLVPVGDTERRDLLEIIEDRYGNRSTILTSQLPSKSWHDHVGDPTIADAICDRLLHNAHKIDLKGESRRKEKETRS